MAMLLENSDERRMFNHSAEVCGHPLKAVAAALTIWAQMNPIGSYGAQCAIMANECMKAAEEEAKEPVE